MNPRQQIEWTDENIAILCALWDEGLSTRLIGLRMGVSKNCIIGKANRLHLSPRPSPVKRGTPKVRTRMPVPMEWR